MTKARQRGATVVEFALILIVYLTFLLGVTDFARLLWSWNAASEATRWGARIAVVCNIGATGVVTHMQKYLPQLTASDVIVERYVGNNINNACFESEEIGSPACTGVNVRITNMNFQWLSPMRAIAATVPMPGFSTYLPREIMGQNKNLDGSAGPDSIECI